jgi:UDP-N-acetylmuramate--alanine ligase
MKKNQHKIPSDAVIFFLGVGGIGMSGLARFFSRRGHTVIGYDRTTTPLTQSLEMEGIEIMYEDNVMDLPSVVRLTPPEKILVCYTPAISLDSKLKKYFEAQPFVKVKRSELLGWVTEDLQTIAVAGTHGKTTTSTLIAHLLIGGDVKASAFLGGISTNYATNVIITDSPLVVAEADEFDRSFLTLRPTTAVVTSVDPDHLDIYGDSIHFQEGFELFVGRIRPSGLLIKKKGIPLEAKYLSADTPIKEYGMSSDCDCYADNIRVEDGKYIFDFHGIFSITDIHCGLPGRHNVENAVAAIAVALEHGVRPNSIKKSMSNFYGVKRRFEKVYDHGGQVVIDDYAHHPTEITAAISSTKELYPNQRVTVVFQPHLFSRTRDFLNGFADSLSLADEVYLLPIYPARELPIPGIDSQLLLDKISISAKYLVEKEQLLERGIMASDQVVLFLGAGDIDALVSPFIKKKV